LKPPASPADAPAAWRTVAGEAVALDNGQHILIGAYAETLRLMKIWESIPTPHCCACR
jgi:predicted NAD/FAD-binding protein